MLTAAGCRALSLSLGLEGCLPRGTSPAELHFVANGTHVDVIVAAGGGIAALRSMAGPAGPEGGAFDPAGFAREVRITLGRLPDVLRQQVREASFRGSPVTAANLCGEIRGDLQRMGIESRLASCRRRLRGGAPGIRAGSGRAASARPASDFRVPAPAGEPLGNALSSL